jgi:tyrosyl-tRNA synthetase
MDIALSEFFYPFMQGYDSVAMDVDVEVGGTDQMFNMLMGRKLMRNIKKKEKFVMTTPILEDSEGKKIGKTEGNVITFNDKPEDFYRKIMALGDGVIAKGLEYLTDVPMEEIEEIKNKLESGENPINFKKKLAFEITKQLNGDSQAEEAAREFEKTVQHKETPEHIELYTFDVPELSLVDILTHSKLVSSNSEAKRLFEQGGVSLDDEVVKDPNINIKLDKEHLLKIGKKKFLRIINR